MIRFIAIWLIFTVLGGLLQYFNFWVLPGLNADDLIGSSNVDLIFEFSNYLAAFFAPYFVLLFYYLSNLEYVAEGPQTSIDGEIVDITLGTIYSPENIARIAVVHTMFFALKFLVVFFLNRRIEKKSK